MTESTGRKPSETGKQKIDEFSSRARSMTPAESPAAMEALTSKILHSQRQAIKKSVLVSAALLAVVAIVGAVFLLPDAAEIRAHREQIAALRSDVDRIDGEMKETAKKQSFLQSMIPGDIEARFGELQQKAQDIESRVAGMSNQAQALTNRFIGPEGVQVVQGLEQMAQETLALAKNPGGLTGLAARLNDLPKTLEGQQFLGMSAGDLYKALQGNPADVDQTLADAQKKGDALGKTLEGVAPEDLKAAALLLALAQARTSFNRDKTPFSEDLALMKTLMGGELDPDVAAALDRLAPAAEKGVLTPQGLQKEFKGLAGEIVVSSLSGEKVSVQEKAKARLNEILRVQKNGELVTGTETQATVARAQKMLDEGNIDGAVAELQKLQGPAAQTAQPWIDQAQATMMVQKAQELLTGNVLSTIGKMSGGGVPYTAGGGGLEQLMPLVRQFGLSGSVVTGQGGVAPIYNPGPSLPGAGR